MPANKGPVLDFTFLRAARLLHRICAQMSGQWAKIEFKPYVCIVRISRKR